MATLPLVDATPVLLGPDEEIAERPFTAVAYIAADSAVLSGMVSDVRRVLHEIDVGRRKPLKPYRKMAWRQRGRSRRLLVSDEARLRSHPAPNLVGFFGERDIGLDITPLEEANTAIVASFADHPGILSYGSVEVGEGHWANLVLHEFPEDRELWRQNLLHAEVVKVLSPVHYQNVRIYNGVLSGPLGSAPTVILHRTKYYDYTGPSPWRAERVVSRT